MYFGMINILIFATFTAIFFKIGTNHINDMTSIAILAISSLIFLFTLSLFYSDPDPFDYFRYSFKRKRIAMMYYYLYVPCLVVSTVLLIIF